MCMSDHMQRCTQVKLGCTHPHPAPALAPACWCLHVCAAWLAAPCTFAGEWCVCVGMPWRAGLWRRHQNTRTPFKSAQEAGQHSTKQKHLGHIWLPSEGLRNIFRIVRERKERVKLLLGHSCASQHLALSPATTRGQVPALLLPAVLQPEEFQERHKQDSKGKPARWGKGEEGRSSKGLQGALCFQPQAALQQAELELLGATGSAGGRRSVRGLGACSANLSRGGMAARARPPRWSKRGVGCSSALTLTSLRMPVCHQVSQVASVHLRASSSSWRALGCQSWGGPQERAGLCGNSNKM